MGYHGAISEKAVPVLKDNTLVRAAPYLKGSRNTGTAQ
jgi:hypothetical protein